ncbi:histidine phosphatase family protein [Butyrivibrio sp. JL13D10]|uniref:histidine phosphatase family protein n=1 Tax=Butyrivibrio sp. JL13D10 TaxID=3236815 RepID=UPI0038B61E1C
MRLIFVRHGEPNYEKDCLTENGKKQAISTALRLKDEDIKAIYASPMGRARQTASYTAESHELDVNILEFMHEIDWGDVKKTEDDSKTSGEVTDPIPYDGHPWTLAYRVLTDTPDYVGKNNWDQHHFFKDNKCMEYYNMISGKFDELLEKYGLVRKDGLYLCKEKNDDTIALFAHGGSGAIMFSHVLSLPFPFVLTSMPYGVCSVSVIEFDGKVGEMVIPRLELFNDMNHIESFKAEKLHFEK